MRVVGYIRVSTVDQADGGVSLEAQETKLRQYASLYDLDLVGIGTDAGVSAKTLDRPGLQRALGFLDRKEASGLLIVKLDRLTRSVVDLSTLVTDYFNDHELLSVSDSIDTRSAAGRLVLNVLVSVAQWEREVIGERTSEALQHLSKQGVKLGGEAVGWARLEETDEEGRRAVAVVERELHTIARIVELREVGLSLRDICRVLTTEGIPTKRGGSWSPKVVRSILMREAV